ncbi:MAG: MFS transporter [Alphaproteobacteria bacterium]|nr:MFS transporter [Alphaproteobacteria bacterium]MCW5742469.1 MFS transporter [Alphaproteobacteria bacterium]
MRRALVPLIATFLVQTLCSAAVLALATMMPRVGPDVGVPSWVIGAFTAIIYGVAATSSFFSAAPLARFGAVRLCQAALLSGALGLAVMTLATPLALVIGVCLVGGSNGPLNAASAAIIAHRVPTAWYSAAFTVKQTGVPFGFAISGAIVPPLANWLGWQGAALSLAAMLVVAIIALQLLEAELEGGAPPIGRPALLEPMRTLFTDRRLRALVLASLLYVVAQHTITFVLVTYLVESCGLSMVVAGQILSVSQFGAAALRLALGTFADRLRERLSLLGVLGVLTACGCTAVALARPDWPLLAIAAAAVICGTTAASWNGLSVGEFARWSPPGQAGAITAASTAVVFSGGVFGPGLFSAVVGTSGSYLAGFALIVVAVGAGGVWLLAEGRRLRREA